MYPSIMWHALAPTTHAVQTTVAANITNNKCGCAHRIAVALPAMTIVSSVLAYPDVAQDLVKLI